MREVPTREAVQLGTYGQAFRAETQESWSRDGTRGVMVLIVHAGCSPINLIRVGEDSTPGTPALSGVSSQWEPKGPKGDVKERGDRLRVERPMVTEHP